MTQYVEDAPSDQYYGVHSCDGNTSVELAEICTPIKIGETIIGIIGLVAFSENQKAILLDKKRSMVTFVEKMADLLAAKAQQQAALADAELAKKEMNTVFETAHEGILAIDKRGYINHCNALAAAQFKTSKQEIIGEHLNKYMVGSPALSIIETGKGYTEHEELYRSDKGGLHVIVTAKPFYSGTEIGGVVISFRTSRKPKSWRTP